MNTPTLSRVLQTTAHAFGVPLPSTLASMAPDPLVDLPAAAKPNGITPILANGLWTIAQHACRWDRDTSAASVCAFLAARALRYGAERVRKRA